MTCRAAPIALTAVLGAALVAPALAERKGPDPKRKVAVLEYRAGSAELEAIDEKLVVILGSLTSLAIMDAQEARTLYGSHLDADVVTCAGEPACVADIGGKLGVDEVLLVGVSEFGDVILTLQRIDVRKRTVVTRIAEALAQGESPESKSIRRYLKRVMPKSDFLRFGTIRIDSNVAGAKVTIDDMPRGTTPLMPIRVPAPATYRIAIRKSGYLPFRATVAVPPDAEVKVRPVLARTVKDAWYKRWWVAAAVGTVAAGAAAAILIYGRDDPTDVPGRIPPF
jgi:hypothetical protein